MLFFITKNGNMDPQPKNGNTCLWQNMKIHVHGKKVKYVSVSQSGSMYPCHKMEVCIRVKRWKYLSLAKRIVDHLPLLVVSLLSQVILFRLPPEYHKSRFPEHEFKREQNSDIG